MPVLLKRNTGYRCIALSGSLFFGEELPNHNLPYTMQDEELIDLELYFFRISLHVKSYVDAKQENDILRVIQSKGQ